MPMNTTATPPAIPNRSPRLTSCWSAVLAGVAVGAGVACWAGGSGENGLSWARAVPGALSAAVSRRRARTRTMAGAMLVGIRPDDGPTAAREPRGARDEPDGDEGAQGRPDPG